VPFRLLTFTLIKAFVIGRALSMLAPFPDFGGRDRRRILVDNLLCVALLLVLFWPKEFIFISFAVCMFTMGLDFIMRELEKKLLKK